MSRAVYEGDVADANKLSPAVWPVTRKAIWIAGACGSEHQRPLHYVSEPQRSMKEPVASGPGTFLIGATVDLRVGISKLNRDVPLESEGINSQRTRATPYICDVPTRS